MCFANVPLGGLIFSKCVEVEVERRMWMGLSLRLFSPSPPPPYAGFKQAILAVLFHLKWKAIYIRRWWWWVPGLPRFPGDRAPPSFDRLWGAPRRRFPDTPALMVNWPEWLSFKWNRSITTEDIGPLLRNHRTPLSQLFELSVFNSFSNCRDHHLPRN